MYHSNVVSLVAEGPFGLFTKPEFRADRVSQRFMPPTAAQGMAKAIFWHPECDLARWNRANLEVEIVRIHLLSPIVMMTMRGNEIPNLPGLESEVIEDPRQTSMLVLKDLKYLVELRYVAWDGLATARKGEEMFLRRLEKGQHWRQPAFGRRRYPAYVRPPRQGDKAIDYSEHLGPLPWWTEYRGTKVLPHNMWAELKHGVLEVPPFLHQGEAP